MTEPVIDPRGPVPAAETGSTHGALERLVPAAAPADERPHLAVVIPAYNEATRLGGTLEAVVAYLAEQTYDAEVLVVLDGCTDGTEGVANQFAGQRGPVTVRVIANAVNRGKGSCVRQGMLAARARYRFFTDADLSYPIAQVRPFLAALEDRGGVAIASRDTSGIRYQSLARRLVTVLSRWVMHHLVVPGIHDTQAGFKGFTGAVADDVFATQRLRGFGFDAEILHIAHLRGYPIAPMAVEWRDVPGSSVKLWRDVPKMAVELGSIALNRVLGRYRK